MAASSKKSDVTRESVADRLEKAIAHIKKHGVVHGTWVIDNDDEAADYDGKVGSVCAIGAISLLNPGEGAQFLPRYVIDRDPLGVAVARLIANVVGLPLAQVSYLDGTVQLFDPIDAVSNWFEGEDSVIVKTIPGSALIKVLRQALLSIEPKPVTRWWEEG